jgi:hypothetical protein
MGGLPTIRSYVNKAPKGRHKRNKHKIKDGKRHSTVVWEFGTNSVQLRERKSGSLASKRHQMKHLDFLSLLLESRRSVNLGKGAKVVGSIPTAPTNIPQNSQSLPNPVTSEFPVIRPEPRNLESLVSALFGE